MIGLGNYVVEPALGGADEAIPPAMLFVAVVAGIWWWSRKSKKR